MDKICQFWRCLWPQATYFTGFWHFIDQTTNRLIQRIINSSPVVHVMCLAAQNIDLTLALRALNVWLTKSASQTCHRLITAPVCGTLFIIFVVHKLKQNICDPVQRERMKAGEWSSYLSTLHQPEKNREVCLIKKQKWLATVITDIPLSLLTTGLLCDLTYICVRYCTYNKTNTCTHSPVG